VVQFDKEASQTRDYCVAKNATLRAARPDPSLAQRTLVQDDNPNCTTTDNGVDLKLLSNHAASVLLLETHNKSN
jgi:hypothetical protein